MQLFGKISLNFVLLFYFILFVLTLKYRRIGAMIILIINLDKEKSYFAIF